MIALIILAGLVGFAGGWTVCAWLTDQSAREPHITGEADQSSFGGFRWE